MAATTIAFYGVLLKPSEEELESLENRSHPVILNAKKASLQYYWGNFGGDGELYLLFVGKLLGKLGVEDASELHLDGEQLANIAAEVSSKLASAGFTETPTFCLRFQPDD